jgi:hypothetical protein
MGSLNLDFKVPKTIMEALRRNGYFSQQIPQNIIDAQDTLASNVLDHFRSGVSNTEYVHEGTFTTGYYERAEGARVFITPLTTDIQCHPWQNTAEFRAIFEYHVSYLDSLADKIGVPANRQYFMAINYYQENRGQLKAHTDFGYLTSLVTTRGVHYFDPDTNEWDELMPVHGEAICQCGGALQVIDNDYFAMPHAVIAGAEKVSFVILCDPVGEMTLRAGHLSTTIDASDYIRIRFMGLNHPEALSEEETELYSTYLEPLMTISNEFNSRFV